MMKVLSSYPLGGFLSNCFSIEVGPKNYFFLVLACAKALAAADLHSDFVPLPLRHLPAFDAVDAVVVLLLLHAILYPLIFIFSGRHRILHTKGA